MSFVEGMALLGFVAMLGWIVVEIAWRNPGSPREIIWDPDAFGRKKAPPEAAGPAVELRDARTAPPAPVSEATATAAAAKDLERAS
jgi:hypothetical protein